MLICMPPSFLGRKTRFWSKSPQWQSRPLDLIYPHCLFGLYRSHNENVSGRDYKAVKAHLPSQYKEEKALAELERLG